MEFPEWRGFEYACLFFVSVDCLSLEEMHQLDGSGSTSWDQFSLNKEKFGIDSHFNEELYTIPMSSLQINKDEWEEAVSAAREIEGNESERGGYLLLL